MSKFAFFGAFWLNSHFFETFWWNSHFSDKIYFFRNHLSKFAIFASLRRNSCLYNDPLMKCVFLTDHFSRLTFFSRSLYVICFFFCRPLTKLVFLLALIRWNSHFLRDNLAEFAILLWSFDFFRVWQNLRFTALWHILHFIHGPLTKFSSVLRSLIEICISSTRFAFLTMLWRYSCFLRGPLAEYVFFRYPLSKARFFSRPFQEIRIFFATSHFFLALKRYKS